MDRIRHLHRNFGLDLEFLVEVFCLFLAQVYPEFHEPYLIHEQFESNIHLHQIISHQIVLIRTLMTTCWRSVSVSESSQDTKQFSVFPSQHDATVLTLLDSTVHHFPQKQCQRCLVHLCSHRMLQQWCFYTC